MDEQLDELRRELERLESPRGSHFPNLLRDAECAERAAARLGHPALVQRARLAQADALIRTGSTAAGGRLAREVSREVDVDGEDYVRARSAIVMARFFRYLGDRQRLLELSVKAAELLPEDAPPLVKYDHGTELGIGLALMRSYDSARRQFDRVRALVEEAGAHYYLPAIYNNAAYAEYEAGNLPAALDLAERMVAAAAALDEPPQASWIDTLGRIYLAAGRLEEARDVLIAATANDGRAVATEGDAIASCELTLAEVLRAMGDVDGAHAVLERCLEACEASNLAQVHAEAQLEMAQLFAAQGRWQEAFERHVVFHDEWEQVSAAERDAHARIIQAVYETTEAREESERYRELSMHDPLTGLANRRYLQERLPALMGENNRESQPLALALVDLDHFKDVNDALGHEVGDAVLVEIGRILEGHAGEGFAARMGGEEFLLVLPATEQAAAAHLCEVVRLAIEGHDWSALVPGRTVTASTGLAVSGPDRRVPELVLRAADAALYSAKAGGRNRVEIA